MIEIISITIGLMAIASTLIGQYYNPSNATSYNKSNWMFEKSNKKNIMSLNVTKTLEELQQEKKEAKKRKLEEKKQKRREEKLAIHKKLINQGEDYINQLLEQTNLFKEMMGLSNELKEHMYIPNIISPKESLLAFKMLQTYTVNKYDFQTNQKAKELKKRLKKEKKQFQEGVKFLKEHYQFVWDYVYKT